MFNKLRYISLIFYSVILLMGQMTGIPFIFWLLLTVFDFGNSDQIFAIIGLIGFFIQLIKPNEKPSNKELCLFIFSFIFLIVPIIKRVLAIPIENYNYLAFVIPLTFFIVLQIIALILKIRDFQNHTDSDT